MNQTLFSQKRLKDQAKYFGKNLQSKVLILFLLFLGVLGFAQIQKLDFQFKELLSNKDKLAKGQKIKTSRIAENALQEKIVVTSKGARSMYSSIIYAKNPLELKKNGIVVQSEYKNFVTAFVSIEDLEMLSLDPNVISVVSPTIDGLHNDVSTAQSGASLLHAGTLNNVKYTGKNTLVGIFDTGIDWKHPDFRDPVDQSKSRIYSIWDQTISATGTETPPSTFTYGVEYTRAMIEDELDGSPTNFVRQTDTNGHGSHVAGTAAGNGAAFSDKRHKGFAPEADIVFVKGGNGSFPQSNTINAMAYFQKVATDLGKPIVVNMSIGGQASAHDGTEAHEVVIDQFSSSAPGRVVVISAGNDYNAANPFHAKVEIPAGGTGTYTLAVATSSGKTEMVINQINIYASNNNSLVSKVTVPDGTIFNYPVDGAAENNFGQDSYYFYGDNEITANNNKRRLRFQLGRLANATTNSGGNYVIEITNNGTTPVTLHGYKLVEVPTPATTLVNGDNQYIVGSPGNATSAITVANYFGRGSWYSSPTPAGYSIGGAVEGIASSSSQGPRADGVQKPEIAASGQMVISALSSSVNTAGITPYLVDGTYYRANSGTSMSSPGVAGAVALLLGANPNLSAAQIKTKLTSNTYTDAATGTAPNARWGYGKLDIYKAVAEEVGCQTSEFEKIIYDQQFTTIATDLNYTVPNSNLAVLFAPTRIGKLGSVTFSTGTAPFSDAPLVIEVRKVEANKPGELIASKTVPSILNNLQRFSWNTIDLTDLNVQVKTGEEFFIVLNASAGNFGIRAENVSTSGRSRISTDNGITWNNPNVDLRIRTTVYEDQPAIKKLAVTNLSTTAEVVEGNNYFINNCEFIGSIEKTAADNITGNVTAKVWLANPESTYVARRYEITPSTNPTTATGKVTLYFTQAEFDAYNATNSVKLPTSPSDAAGKANVLIDKFAGTSSDNSGSTSSYSNGFVTLTPSVENIKWNATYQYWEVTIDTVGFSGFFVRTSSSSLASANVKQDQVAIYPNPVKDVLNIDLKTNQGEVKIFDLSGKVIKTASVNKSGSVDVSKFSKGLYIVEITINGTSKVTKKIIKE